MSISVLNPQHQNCRIAVIGIGCYYPGANSPLQLWENILARRRQFREMPDVRLPNADYYDPDPLVPNKTYQNKAAVLDGYQFDWLGKRIPKQTYESTDIVHWLALDTALQAISDANYQKNSIPKEKTGVILGNTLTGEFTRSNQMLLRWPYVRKALRLSARQKGLSHVLGDLEPALEENYKSVFAPVTEDTLAGGLANTIAGRVCNYLDIHGGGYIVDGACSSSLLATVTAANYLELGQMDMVIAGGVDISLDTFELIGFAKTGALTPDEMRVYDVGGKGFLPGEGCGMVVLKRMEDAVRDKDQIYAVINGWGISSDGKGGITAPSATGQSRALLRAYAKAGFDPSHLDFIEGHGTGTTVGDKVELEGISIALGSAGNISDRKCGVTSFKSIVGHTKAAAGIGALIKTVMSVNRRILPPTAGLKEMNPIFNDKAKAVYPILNGQIRDPQSTVFAGVSAMGFGGINSHVVLESAGTPNAKLQSSVDERKLLVSNQSHELYIFSAVNSEELQNEITSFSREVKGISYAEMQDVAFDHNSKTDFAKPFRASVIADTPFELERKLKELRNKISTWTGQTSMSLENNTVVAGVKQDNLRIGAVFPGQGSQKINMGRKLSQRHDWLHEMVSHAAAIFTAEKAEKVIPSLFRPIERASDQQQIAFWQVELKQTNNAQPAITLASLIWHEYIKRLGITINCVSGHSLGELMSFYASGLLDMDTLLRFSVFRGKSMAENGSGTMASLQCEKEKVEKYISDIPGYITVANINGPQQTVVSGEKDTIKEIIRLAQADQVNAVELPVSAAFHSQLVAEVANQIKSYDVLQHKSPKNPDIVLVSSTNGKTVDKNVDLNTYFSFQAINQVDFIRTVQELEKNCDILLEIGPGRVLSGLVSNISAKLKCFPVELNADDDLSLNVMLGNVFVMGGNISIRELYKDRLVREFVAADKKAFLVNPLERPFPESLTGQANTSATGLETMVNMNTAAPGFDNYLKARSGFIREIIDADFRYYTKGHQTGETISTSAYAVTNVAPAVVKEPEPTLQNSDVRKTVYDRIESLTGFSSEGFKEHMKLLDDFNLDSIKSGSLLNGLAKSLNVTGKINASELSNASLAEVVAAFERVTSGMKDQAGSVVKESPKETAENDIPRIIYKMLAERTGFPPEALRPDYKLLDDLNLDSIKAGAFIAEIAKKLNIRGKLETANLANANIEDIIETVSNSVGANTKTEKAVAPDEHTSNWVNAYTVSLTEEPLTLEDHNVRDFWAVKSLVLVHPENEESLASGLAEILKSQVTKVVSVKSNNLHLLTSFENSGVLVLIPPDRVNSEAMNRIVSLLADVSAGLADTNLLGFIQWNDGRFSRTNGNSGAIKARYSAVSFAASVHHERPDIRIRVVEADTNLAKEKVVEVVLKEFLTDAAFDVAGYDSELVRRKMRYEHAFSRSGKHPEIAFSEEDVVIATGGAKGITAECAYSFARKYRCKTALIGSSPMNEDISGILKRYEKENLVARYYACDIADSAAVKQVTKKASDELGNITVVIHGAGKNTPRRIEKVSAKEAMNEIAPKLLGVMNLCESLKEEKLKYFISLTSIIGVTGMPGNSWYAFSNENVDLYLREAGKRGDFRVRTLAYSIWGEIGMGVRMGSTKILANMGIGAISPILGVEQFLQWIENESFDQQVVITAGLGGLDTWSLKKPVLPDAKRYISDIRYLEPGREIITRVKLSRITDLYIDDHNYGGSLLFPTVFGLEAMAQSACLVAGLTSINSVVFENISLQKPIVVPENGEIEIGIKATIIDSPIKPTDPVRVYAGVSTEHAGFSSFHFSAEIILNETFVAESKTVVLPEQALKISPKSDLYTWLLFQGRRFQNIKKIYNLKSDLVELTTTAIENDPAVECFAESCRTPLLLGSPLLRDVLLQSVQIFLTSKKYLPVAIKRWQFNNIGKQSLGGVVISRLNELKDDRGFCDVEYIVDGLVNEKIDGYQVKALEPTDSYPSPVALSGMEDLYLNAIAEGFGKHNHLLNNPINYKAYKHDIEFNYLNRKTRHHIEDELFLSMISEVIGGEDAKNCKLVRAANGKPSISNSDLHISIAHSRSVLLMLTGKEEQGCDIEFVEKRSKSEWNDLFENKVTRLLEQLQAVDNDLNLSATRLWCVRESLIKSTGMMPLSISLFKNDKEGVVFRVKTGERDNITILTFPVTVLPSVTAVIAAIVNLKESETSTVDSKTERTVTQGAFDSGLNGFSHNFITTFKDCTGFFGKTHFTNYPDWMGTLRELVLAPIGSELLNDLGSGEFGMVTNLSEVQIFNEAETLNQITGNLWITNKSELDNSFIDLNFEFLKKDTGSNSMIRLAKCNLSTTWVKIEGRGIVKKVPIPDYFLKFLNKHLLRTEPTGLIMNGTSYPVVKNLGQLVYEDPQKIRPQILLTEKEFQTGISNGNTVGNLYYSNYYQWQSKIMEQFLYELVPGIMTGNGRNGEFLTLESNVKHLQEAMPFENILVSMYVENIYENGFKFHFEYFSKAGDQKRKLAFGSNTVIWAKRTNERSLPVVGPLPEEVFSKLNSMVLV
jgi:enediyne polyketide synthase